MINLGKSYEVDHWPDNWTAVTVDGKRSAQFEETLLLVSIIPRTRLLRSSSPEYCDSVPDSITADGVEVITAARSQSA